MTTMERDEMIAVLSNRGIFKALDDAAVGELIAACEPVTRMSGQPLWSQGDVGQAAFILLEGRVEMSWRAQPQGQRKQQYSEPGDLLSLSSLVHPWRHRSAATPLERTELLMLERDDFQRLFDAQHPAAYQLVDAIANNLVADMRDANRRLHEVFGHPAETLRMLRRRTQEEARG